MCGNTSCHKKTLERDLEKKNDCSIYNTIKHNNFKNAQNNIYVLISLTTMMNQIKYE